MTGNLPRTLTIASLLSILLMTLHQTDDILRNQDGVAEGGFLGVVVVLGLVVWLYGTLMLAERRSGYVINLVFSLLASLVAVGHTTGVGDVVVGQIATSSGAFFVFVVVALGVTAISSLILSAYGLWSLQRGQARQPTSPNTDRPAARRASLAPDHDPSPVTRAGRTFDGGTCRCRNDSRSLDM